MHHDLVVLGANAEKLEVILRIQVAHHAPRHRLTQEPNTRTLLKRQRFTPHSRRGTLLLSQTGECFLYFAFTVADMRRANIRVVSASEPVRNGKKKINEKRKNSSHIAGTCALHCIALCNSNTNEE